MALELHEKLIAAALAHLQSRLEKINTLLEAIGE